MIHGTPQIMGLAVDLHIDLIDMPLPMTKATHTANPLPPNISREHRTKPVPPEPNRLMADIDTALKQQVLHVPQAKWETHIHQNGAVSRMASCLRLTRLGQERGSVRPRHSATPPSRRSGVPCMSGDQR